MRYISTRGGGTPQSFEDVLLAGLAPDGGLYMPMRWPRLDLNALKGRSYADVAEAVMFPFVEGSLSRQDFSHILHETYNANIFRHPRIVPLRQLYPHIWALELFHGPTIAFKDVALQLLGRLFDHALKKQDRRMTIVGATSGDTGSAAIEGCKACANAEIFILHPRGRVSEVQRRQMTTLDAPNVHNIALEGNFDDCQAMVKSLFNDSSFRAEMNLSAVNSINWARIMAQIVYYVTAALELGAPEKDVSFAVPTGNFGNVLAGWCARQMGLPIKTLAIASNRNDILTRFFETGEMKAQPVQSSLSPSMDIQVSSNFERFLFEILLRHPEDLRDAMQSFTQTGLYKPAPHVLEEIRRHFRAFRASDAETLEIIRKVHGDTGYILDPHTAVGMKAAQRLAGEGQLRVVTLACAHPAKFPDAVADATGVIPVLPPCLGDLMSREERFTILPNDVESVKAFVRGLAE
ncbi:MAG: threonine synthase [Alphaproteobacteria bacterium]|nr:threonine synthase [Alphaproteobacteria bacterium]